MSDKQERLNIDRNRLTEVVRKAAGSNSVKIADWACESLQGGVGMGTAIYRVSGTGENNGSPMDWSLILKVLSRVNRPDDPGHYRYWKREALLFESGLLERLPGSLKTPICYGTDDVSGDECWVWMEAIENLTPHWPLERYAPVARHFGQFNGAYLTGEPLPEAPWLSKGWLRALVDDVRDGVEQLRDHYNHPMVQRAFPRDVFDGIQRLWEEHSFFLDVIDRLPQTFCHRDANWRNLFHGADADGRSRTIAIDWAETGFGAVGEEMVGLTGSSIVFGAVEPAQFEDLDRIVSENYLAGLREAGWMGDERIPRLGYAAALSVHYSFKALKPVVNIFSNEDGYESVEQWFAQMTGRQRTMLQICDEGAVAQRFTLDLAEESRSLISELGI